MEQFIIYEKGKDNQLLSMNIFIDKFVEIENGAKLFSGCKLIGNCKIAGSAEIHENSILENSSIGNGTKVHSSVIKDSVIGDNCNIGPFAQIRDNSNIGDNCRIGNFVEIKKSIIAKNCKIAHLSYVGDAEIGINCNIGCGVVFCNYDGKQKNNTIVGENVFIGSNSNLVAPLSISDNAFIAAGSTITFDVEANQLAIARAKQKNTENFKNPYLEN